MTKKQKKELEKARRNLHALNAIMRTGAGNHGDKRKEKLKNACRGKIKW